MNPFRSLFLSLSRIPPVMMLFVILGLAVVVTMYIMQVVGDAQHQVEVQAHLNDMKAHETSKVVVAARNIDEGEMISADALAEQDVPTARLPMDALSNANAVVGMQAAYPIPAQTIVSTHALRQMVLHPDFTGKIHEGMRALTFGVDSNSGVAGFITPGSHVDILGITGQSESTKAAPVMSDVEVVAVGTTYQRAPGSTVANPAGSVTVAVTPENCLKLVKAVTAAKLYLALRSDRDHTPIAVVDVKDLFPHKLATDMSTAIASVPLMPLPAPPAGTNDQPEKAGTQSAPLPPPLHEIEMWNGSRKEVLSVPQG